MKKLMMALLFSWVVLPSPIAVAGEVTVVKATAHRVKDGRFRFRVTLRHGDTGWKHYADKWEVLTLDGKLLARRVLLHPHEHEQPFTRSLGGVKIPGHVRKVRVRGHDKIHAFGGQEVEIELPGR